MLDLTSDLTMPIKDTATKISKPEDCAQKTTPKRSPVDMKDVLQKGVAGSCDGEELMLEVTCGQNQAALYMSRLQLGSKGTCVLFDNAWLTPNEFQYVSGRETAKDWKRSIKHHGKSLKVLISKGILTTSPLRCNCGQCAQTKDKDTSKYVTTDDATLPNGGPLRESFVTDAAKLSTPEPGKDLPDRRFFRISGDVSEKLRENSHDSSSKQRSLTEQCVTGHSQEGARYLASCGDNGFFGASQGGRFERQEGHERYAMPGVGGGGGCNTQGGHVGKYPDMASQEVPKTSTDAKMKAKKKLDGSGNEVQEFSRDQLGCRGFQSSDHQKVTAEQNKVDSADCCLQTPGAPKKCGTSSARPTSEGSGPWSQGNLNIPTDQGCHSNPNACKVVPHEKTKKSTVVGPSTDSSSPANRPSCSRLNISPSGKNSVPNTGSCTDAARMASSESSFVFPSFGSPYYPMITPPQLPAYYPNPYVWPVPFPANPSACSYGWTAPSEMAASNCLRSPTKESFDSNPSSGDQAFNFPWMKRANYSTLESQSGRDTTSDIISSGKRKHDNDASEYFSPSKFYLSEGLRPGGFGESLAWPAYAPSAAALDFRFLPYSLPSYIPDGRTTHGMFANNFLKGSEIPAAGGLGLYPGLFSSPCHGINSR